MSARPQPGPVRVDDLDLLISRSLDGDLGPEEERQLELVLESDPSARNRRAAMASLVERLETLPEPETPFALATRVSAQVDEGTRGLSASFHRFGLFPGKGAIGVGVGALVVLAVGVTLMNPPKVTLPYAPQVAEKADDGPVQVFFPEKAKDAGSATTDSRALPPAASRADAAPERQPLRDTLQKGQEVTRLAEARPAAPAPTSPPAEPAKGEVLASADRFAPERDAAGAKLEAVPSAVIAQVSPAEEVVETQGRRERGRTKAGPAPPTDAAQPSALGAVAAAGKPSAPGNVAAAPAPAAPASRAAGLASKERSNDAPTRIEVVAGSGWRLAASARIEGLPSPFNALYRLSLDAGGHVTAVARISGDAAPAGVDEHLRALSFLRDGALDGPPVVEIRLVRP